MRTNSVKLLGACAAMTVATPTMMAADNAKAKPNILFLLVDDLGWGDLGCFGSKFYETPNIDALCAQGMKFTQAYSACTVCSPSRAAIITGCAPARLHLTDWIAGHKRPYAKLKIPDWQMYIDNDRIIMPQALAEGGYDNIFIGKWHLMPRGKSENAKDHTPEKQGFMKNIAGCDMPSPRGPGKFFYPFGMPNLDGKKGDYLTDRLTDEAVKYIDNVGDKPFLLYMSYYAVHKPHMCKPEYKEYFQKKLDSAPPGTYKQTDTIYAGMLKSLDESVGRLVAALKKTGKYENTVIFFTGDNGSTIPSSSGGLRGTKGTSFEGGTREPTFVVWPGVVKPGSECNTPIIGMDYYPTMLDIAGLPQKPDQHKDGESILPLLKGTGSLKRDALYWHYPHYHMTAPYSAIHSKGWKLIELLEDGELMLFNLKDDMAEQHNVIKENPELAQELLKKLQEWRKSVNAQMPTQNPNYDAEKDHPLTAGHSSKKPKSNKKKKKTKNK